jgi:ATP-binding cassette, subfamily B, multidrug efflux pump
VGERGVMLSGGQKQRISIARALIKSPDIVLLDDCLSAVDTKTEKRILQYFENELTNKTVLLITHRVSGLAHFDKIIVLQNGQIAEMGTHKQLMKQNGYYAEQWALAMNKPEPQASEL